MSNYFNLYKVSFISLSSTTIIPPSSRCANIRKRSAARTYNVDRMINDDSQYLSHSRENFSNIVLSVPSGNGISILARTDKRRSRTHRTSHSRSRQFPKRVKASRMKNERSTRMKWRKVVQNVRGKLRSVEDEEHE